MGTLAVDIITTAPRLHELPKAIYEALTKWVYDRASDETSLQRYISQVERRLPTHPLTATITALTVYDIANSRTAVYVVGEGDDIDCGEYFLKFRTEEQVLREFWQGAVHFDVFVTFDGRRIALPLITHRSRMYGIATRRLLQGRYPSQQHTDRHIDLLDELNFFGVWRQPETLEEWAQLYQLSAVAVPRQVQGWPPQAQSAITRIRHIGELYDRIYPSIIV